MDDSRYKVITNNEEYAKASHPIDAALSKALHDINKSLNNIIADTILRNLCSEVYVVNDNIEAISIYRTDEVISIVDNRKVRVRKSYTLLGKIKNLVKNMTGITHVIKILVFNN
jgi:hypothetical protein